MMENKEKENVSGYGSTSNVGDKCERCENGPDPLLNYVTGNIRYTVYGPDHCLSKRSKRYRMMNLEEYIEYSSKVKESGGFDVDGCTGSLHGGIGRVAPTSPFWALAVLAAQFSVQKHAEDGGPLNLEYKQLIKANVQAVEGEMYYLTFTAIDKSDGIEKVYRSRLWAPPNDLILRSLECYTGSEKSAEEMRVEMTALLESAVEKGIQIMTPEYYLNGHAPGPPTVMRFPEFDKKDATRGLFYFLNEIRSKKPHLKYAAAKRAASRRCRSLKNHDKSFYKLLARSKHKMQSLGQESSSHHA